VSFSPVYALSFHADYRCAHSGVCCSSDWDVPVELPIYRSLDEALTRGLIAPAATADGGGPPLLTGDDLPDDAGAMLARTTTGDCVFFHRGSSLCVVHRDAGEAALPATCRHFPRLAVRDRRGTFMSLTHFCPTAARSLFREPSPIAIVESPPAFPPADYEGLEVEEDAWPPLLHARMLMDFDAYSAWERHMVERCADADATVDEVLATLRRDAGTLSRFLPGEGTLLEAIAALRTPAPSHPRTFAPPSPSTAAPSHLAESLAAHRQVMNAVPDDLKPSPDEHDLEQAYADHVAPFWGAWQLPLRRYLAAKAFANWTAYQGRGVLAIVGGLEAAIALVRVEAARQCRDAGRPLDEDLLREAIRRADFALNHLAVGEDLAEAWSRAEESVATPR
jgi:hypothetical protein